MIFRQLTAVVDPRLDIDECLRLARYPGVIEHVLDVRTELQFDEAHLPGSVFEA